jgi:hypothetical protein
MAVQTDPYTFVNGTTADALEVNARFNPLYTLQNAAIDSSNMNLTTTYTWTGIHTHTVDTKLNGGAKLVFDADRSSHDYIYSSADEILSIFVSGNEALKINETANTFTINSSYDVSIGDSKKLILGDGTPETSIKYVESTEVFSLTVSGNAALSVNEASNTFDINVNYNTRTGKISPATNNTYPVGDSSFRFTEIFATNGTINTSDERLKKNIKPLEQGVELIAKLNPVSFQWIDTKESDGQDFIHYGFIAQEVDQIIDSNTSVVEKSGEFMGMRYHELIAPMVLALKELKGEIDFIKSKLHL